METNKLILIWDDKPMQKLYMDDNEFLSYLDLWNTRPLTGHPEGFIEAFANIYRNFALTVMAKRNGKHLIPIFWIFPLYMMVLGDAVC